MDEMTDKEAGKECITKRKEAIAELTGAMDQMVKLLNTESLVVIGCHTKAGDRFLLAVCLGPDKYCPLGVLEPTERLQDGISEVYLNEKYEFVHQSKVDGVKEYYEVLKK